MARYRMEDGTIIDTSNAVTEWDDTRESDGSNMIGRNSRSQWHDWTLYRSRRGRYYVEHIWVSASLTKPLQVVVSPSFRSITN
jgi:hypothetical protein